MITVVGLQNPGAEYTNTRHNVGEMVVRAFQERHNLPSFVPSSQYAGEISEGVVDGQEVRLLLPTTYMNKSGSAVKKALHLPEGLIVVHDELALPLGEFKIGYNQGAGSHNGVQSIIDALGMKAFTRLRVGISPTSFFGNMRPPKGERRAKFVLQTFSKKEMSTVEAMLPEVLTALETILTQGREKAMNQFNVS
ncbi:aminoacyl-tRNA hydrolase [Candidatus Kaiserbacteria bacterium]|nr:aminoacyl-tRNA hydrolase [Candidatus Kaiserbacteria bacterium]